MRRLLEIAATKIKGREYHIDENLSTRELLGVFSERTSMLVRGLFRGFRMKKRGKFLFIGKRVKIKSPGKISIGNGATIADGCIINAMSKDGITIGKEFTLGANSIIDCTGLMRELGESLVIGNNVGISPNFTAFVRGKVSIGNDTIIGPNVTIVAENHIADDVNVAIRKQGTKRAGVSIGDNCWIGAKVTILDGVEIGTGAIVAAGAVVNNNVDPYTVVGGVPVKVLKSRKI